MTARMRQLADEIMQLQAELDREIERRRKALGWTASDRLVRFEHGITMEHRRFRTRVTHYLARSSAAAVLTAPVIYSVIIPIIILDLWVSFYQAICFRAYRIPRVRRSDYVAIDRQHLAYLNWIEALNCTYCAYANGVIGYAREVASRTEQYWCPIKHALRVTDPPRRYFEFLEFGDAGSYRARLAAFRKALRSEGLVPDAAPRGPARRARAAPSRPAGRKGR